MSLLCRFFLVLLSCLLHPFCVRAESVAATYVDNEFATLRFSSSGAVNVVTHLDRIEPTFATLATRSGFGEHTLRDTGLTPGTAYSYRIRFVDTQDGRGFTNNPVTTIIAGDVQGTVDQSMTWEGARKLRRQVIVPTNVTLTVAAGAVVELGTNFSGVGGLDVLGRMEARGARFHNSTNNPDSFGFRITSGENLVAPFGSMLLSNCLFRQTFVVAFHGLEWGGNTTDLAHDQSRLQWQEVPPGYVFAGEIWPTLAVQLSPQGTFTMTNCLLRDLFLEPSVAIPAPQLVVEDVVFRRSGAFSGEFETRLPGGASLIARRLRAETTNDHFGIRVNSCFADATNSGRVEIRECTGFSELNLNCLSNALVANCTMVPNPENTSQGVHLSRCQGVEIRNNVLRGRSVTLGAGVHLETSSGCTVFGNDIRGYHRAFNLEGGTGHLLTSNVCQNAGSLLLRDDSFGPPTNNVIANNSFANGNAIFYDGQTAVFSNIWNFAPSPGPNIRGGPLLGGNFWCTAFSGSDTNADGFLDASFNLRTNNFDFFPLAPDTTFIVNERDDRADANPFDCEADVDLTTPGLQTTLRAALTAANALTGRKRILFDLGSATPQMPPFVITVTNGPLPALTDGITLDARTQPNRVLLDGTNRPNTSGLTVNGDTNVILGLWLRNWGAAGVMLGAFADSNIVQQCRFGIDPADPPATDVNLGTHALVVQGLGNLIGGELLEQGNEFGNARQFGVQVFGSQTVTNQGTRLMNNLVGFTVRGGAARAQPNRGGGVEIRSAQFTALGAPEAGNFIAGNTGSGVFVNNGFGGFARDNLIQGNEIGFIPAAFANDPDRLTNSSHGIEIDTRVTNTVVGATLAETLTAGNTLAQAANRIAFNGGSGIRMSSATARRNSWRHNLIYDNRNLGLDLGAIGVTTNNNSDGFQNFPVFSGTNNIIGKQVAGFLASGPGDYQLEFYSSPQPDPSYHGEGRTYLGSLPLTIPPGADSNSFVFPLPPNFVEYVSAVATDANGHSSEFSPVFGPIIVNLETDEGDPNLADGVPDVNLSLPGLQTTLRCALQHAERDTVRDVIRFAVPQVRITANLAVVHPVIVDGEFNGASVAVTCAQSQPIVFAGPDTELRKLSFFQDDGLVPTFNARTVVQFLRAHRAKLQGCSFFDCDARVTSSSAVEIGGAAAGEGNEFTFRGHDGRVLLEGALTTGARILGNKFNVMFPKTPTLELVDAPGNIIGLPGPTPGAGAGNTFGTSGATCILLRGAGCRDNRIQGNSFGLAEGGDNAGIGVNFRDGARDNLVGGEMPAERNEFVFMQLAVALGETAGQHNRILGNLYLSCSGAIDLGGDGLTLNTFPAAVTGPNRRQNFPTFTRKNYLDVIELRGELRGRPNTSHRLELYAAGPPFHPTAERRHTLGSPNRLVGVVPNVTTDASGLAVWTFTPTPSFFTAPVTATATDSEGNTSEFSPVFQEYLVNSAGDEGAAHPDDGDPRVNAGEAVPVVTLRSTLQASAFLQSPARVVFAFSVDTAIPVSSALPNVNVALNFDNTPNDLVPAPHPVTLRGPGAAGAAFDGLTFLEPAGGSSVRGLRLGGFNGSGLVFRGSSNVVEGCFIGAVAGGTGANLASGIEVHGSFNLIGGALGNFIGGNVSNGIALFANPAFGAFGRASGNQIINNLIGFNDDNTAVPNGVGVRIENADGNLIGRRTGQPASFARNFVTANPVGVLITGSGASNNVVTGTLFGEDRTGFQSPVGSLRSVHILNAPRNRIGGASVDENFFVGSSDAAIVVEGDTAQANEIFGNEIGRPRLFFPTQPVNARGIVLQNALDTRIGRQAAEFGNFIGNCSGSALELLGETRGTFVLGNFIGVRETGASASNHAAAAVIDVASTGPASHPNFIGALGLGPLAANRIAHNARGIVVRRGVGQGINGNFIHDNGGPAIDLGDNGVTPNGPDPLDFTSPNHFQDFPDITNIVATANALFVMGRVRSAGGEMRFEFFDNAACAPGGFGPGQTPQAVTFLPTVAGMNAFQFQLPGPRSRWRLLTATATDAFFNTSEFGPCLTVPETNAMDADGDGIPDVIENGSGFTDVNGDGINDAIQANVLFARTVEGGSFITAVTESTVRFGNFAVLPDPTRGPGDPVINPLRLALPPAGVTFPNGLAAFSVTNKSSTGRRALASTGGSALVQVRLTFETNSPINGYWVYAPTLTDTNPSWQRFLTISNEPGATVVLSNSLAHIGPINHQYVVTLNLQDGSCGDGDGRTNGVIQHLAALGLEPFAFREFAYMDSATNPSFSMEIPAVPGRGYVIERSQNLRDWQLFLQTNTPPTVTIRALDTNLPPQFYRAREQ